MKALFSHSKREKNNVTTFYFKPVKPYTYKPGQYTKITIPHENPDNRGQMRKFSFSSCPTEEHVSITTKIPDQRPSSFTRSLCSLREGDAIEMGEAQGDFCLPEEVEHPLVFIAGGIGVTPFRSMIKWVFMEGKPYRIQLIYSAPTESEILFRDVFLELGDNFTPFLSNEPSESAQRLTPDLIISKIKYDDCLIYISGNDTMIKQLATDLVNHSVNPSNIRTDVFEGYGNLAEFNLKT